MAIIAKNLQSLTAPTYSVPGQARRVAENKLRTTPDGNVKRTITAASILRDVAQVFPGRLEAVRGALLGDPATPSVGSEAPEPNARKDWPAFGTASFQAPIVAMPERAGELWPGAQNTEESIIDFLQRVYGAQIGRGMHRVHLGELDAPALKALRGWEFNRRTRWAVLPTLPEHNRLMEAWMATVGEDEAISVLGKAEIKRLRQAANSRQYNKRKAEGLSP